MQGFGYILSIISVILLGAVAAWDGLGPEWMKYACLALGILLSIAGMVLRWLHHRHERQGRWSTNPTGSVEPWLTRRDPAA